MDIKKTNINKRIYGLIGLLKIHVVIPCSMAVLFPTIKLPPVPHLGKFKWVRTPPIIPKIIDKIILKIVDLKFIFSFTFLYI